VSEPVTIHVGDVREGLAKIPAGSVQCCVTSPPYWGLRDYGVDGQIGLEESPDAYVAAMVEVFRGVRRALRDDGVVFLNVGDSYSGGKTGRDDKQNGGGLYDGRQSGWVDGMTRQRPVPSGLKPKDLCMMPWRVALALQADGWYLRSVIVWAKKSPMPESVTDRPTSAWEPIFLLAKSERYFYDAEPIRETPKPWNQGWVRAPKCGEARVHGAGAAGVTEKQYAEVKGANCRNVWSLGAEPYAEAHFATFPTEIPRRAIKAGTSEKGACPACGAPWTRVVERGTNGMDEANAHERTGDWTQERSGKAKCPSGLIVSGRTSGWAPGCDCNAGEPVPCVVLDPFLGSGTTIAVARQLGRHGVGCELNPEYVELAKVRIGKAEKPHTFQDTREADAPLFGTLREVGT